MSIFAGNILCYITDHLSNFVIFHNNGKNQDYGDGPTIRLFTKSNPNKFRNDLDEVNWTDEVLTKESSDKAYDKFDNIMSDVYNRNYFLIKVSRRRIRDKMDYRSITYL